MPSVTDEDFGEQAGTSTALSELSELLMPLGDELRTYFSAAMDSLGEMSADIPDDEIIEKATKDYLALLDPQNPPSHKWIRRQLMSLVGGLLRHKNRHVALVHGKGEPKSPIPRSLAPIQVALIIDRLHQVAQVTPGGANSDDGLGILAIYQTEGEHEGLYRRADMGLLDALGRQYYFLNDAKWFSDFERSIREVAGKVSETHDSDLVMLRNVIYNYRTDERIEFSPEYVWLSRDVDTDLIEQQHPVPQYMRENGVLWDYEEWWSDTVPDTGSCEYLQKVVGASMRPRNDWQKMPCLYSESGSNGKGTILGHIRAMIGQRNCASVPLKDYGSQFGKEQLIGKRLNLPDETEVGAFIKDASEIKSIITNDPITIDRKNKTPITYKPAMFTILTLNGALNFRDKTESMDRRLAIVPMERRFTDGVKDKAIKDDFLLRAEVCEYMVFKMLVEMPKYWDLAEPATVKAALQNHKMETNSVLSYFEEYKAEFSRPFLPFPMLHAHYSAWLKENRPGSSAVAPSAFTRELKALFDPKVWFVPEGGDGKDLRLTTLHWLRGTERVLNEYSYVASVNKWQYEDSGYGVARGLDKTVPRQARGFVHRVVFEEYTTRVAAGSAAGLALVDAVIHDVNQALMMNQLQTTASGGMANEEAV